MNKQEKEKLIQEGRNQVSSGILMTIILVSVCGWVAVVGLVIKPAFWVGALLSIGGSIVIGTVVAYLIKRWWFRGDLADRMIKTLKEGP